MKKGPPCFFLSKTAPFSFPKPQNQTTHFTHDPNGNQLTRTTGIHTETRTYNAFNQLTAMTRPGIEAAYTYRADGLRHSKTVNGRTIYQIWSRGHLLLELNAKAK